MPKVYTEFPPAGLKVVEYTHLYSNAGGSDKEYIVAILPCNLSGGKRYQIMGYYGRRAKAERTSPGAVVDTLKQARTLAERLVSEKHAKGYKVIKVNSKPEPIIPIQVKISSTAVSLIDF